MNRILDIIASCATIIVLVVLIGCGVMALRSVRDRVPGPAPAQVTMQSFQGLRVGMDYEEACDAIGAIGETRGESDVGGIVTHIVIWRNPDGSNVVGTFQNGRLIAKAQAGLR